MNYVAAVNKGSDGRPNFHARKACNYAEEAIQVPPPPFVLFGHNFCSKLFWLQCFGHPLPLVISSTQGCGDELPGECFSQEQVGFCVRGFK